MDDPGVSYVSSEFIFYDGMRRIADVLAAPVYDKYSALVTGGESGENQNEAGQEAGLFVDGKTANTGFEHLELGGETYLQVHREYVWDPDPDYSPFGGVDTLIAYFEGADRDKPWHVIQSQQGDPVAIVDCDATTHVATIVWRAAFEPYGSVVWASNATADPFPRLAMGHKGLFVERLDAPPVVWFFNDDERLAPEADLLVLMRNRQYLPRLGRFLQPDPNATGVAVQPSLAYGGSALPTPDPYVDLHSWAADGTIALAYAMSDPVNGADPTGLSSTISVSASARIMLWAAWAHLMPKPPARSPSPTGDFVQAGAAIGQIGGAMYAAWALGDDLGLRNRALWNIVKEKVVGAGAGIAGGQLGGRVGGRSGRPSGEWRGQGVGGMIGTGIGSLFNNGSTLVIARDIGVGLAQAGFGTVRGSAAGAYVGFAIGAGFYGGTIEYAADSAFDWWRY